MTDRMEYIREKYGISREELDNLNMDEFDYEVLKEKELINYIKGLLFTVVTDESTDLDIVAGNIIDLSKVAPTNRFQKVVLGEIGDFCMAGETLPGQVVAISVKITDAIKGQ